ncbi:MAG: peptide chain release factor 3 [Opitutales bacterium]
MNLEKSIQRRRTFAIISHPDAGKTTLTEKFLLYGGALNLAGSVTAKKNQRASTSDWMELEKQRGISVSSTVLQFDYGDFSVNLLDTPGHRDFSEDTYRVLTAVDAVIMVIDAAKGIESQTKKLFEVCRQRGVPIFTFINKCDRPAKEPLELLDELESVLGIGAFPINWPLGLGTFFRGVYARLDKKVHLFERVPSGRFVAPVSVSDFNDESVRENLDEAVYAQVAEEIEMLDGAGEAFDRDAVLAGETTPVYFGSAVNNFGVQLLLDGFLNLSTPPSPRTVNEEEIAPEDPRFSGFIFKIQANMDPNHRDRIAFLRICSGKFTRDMTVTHVQSGKKVRLSFSQKLFAQERATVDEAFAGDILGLVGHDEFRIGDTLSEDPTIVYDEIPTFAPECFVYIHNPHTSNYKRFRAGLEQLLRENVVQTFTLKRISRPFPLLAAVGPLQFDVVQYRLKSEYGADSKLESTPWKLVKWLSPDFSFDSLADISLPSGMEPGEDAYGNPVFFFSSEWILQYFKDKNPTIHLFDTPRTTKEEVASS